MGRIEEKLPTNSERATNEEEEKIQQVDGQQTEGCRSASVGVPCHRWASPLVAFLPVRPFQNRTRNRGAWLKPSESASIGGQHRLSPTVATPSEHG